MASPAPLQPGRAIAPLPLSATRPLEVSPPALSLVNGPSLVARNWVVPPRPKPGRKPATDTPPTKRKAQNRTAQRAFRERRAHKVSELEIMMDEMEREHEGTVEGLHAQMEELESRLDLRLRDAVDAYENDLRKMEQDLFAWKIRCQDLEGLVLEERSKRDRAEKQLEALANEAIQLNPGNGEQGGNDQPQLQEIPDPQQAYHTPPEMPVGCGSCTLYSRCQCFEEALGMPIEEAADDMLLQKRALSPTNEPRDVNKRLKQALNTPEEEPLETDFTNFSPPPTTTNDALAATTTSLPDDKCGFCEDGSTCLCAELHADLERTKDPQTNTITIPNDPSLSTSQHPTASTPQLTPASGCTNDPGSCPTCRSSATSTLLCTTLAGAQPAPFRALSSAALSADPCPLGAACCRVSKTLETSFPRSGNGNHTGSGIGSSTSGTAPQLSSGRNPTGPTISCADAFTTLSRHPAFARASRDLAGWLPRLVTIPSTATTTAAEHVSHPGSGSEFKAVVRDAGVRRGDAVAGSTDSMGPRVGEAVAAAEDEALVGPSLGGGGG
ncbi:MAG: hypothetical protein LQ340_005450, partial [Diploschistes diacapsis]